MEQVGQAVQVGQAEQVEQAGQVRQVRQVAAHPLSPAMPTLSCCLLSGAVESKGVRRIARRSMSVEPHL